MNPQKLSFPALAGVLVCVLVLGYLLSRGKAGSVQVVNAGPDKQQSFNNALALMQLDSSNKNNVVQSLLSYQDNTRGWSYKREELATNAVTERQGQQYAYQLGMGAIDSQNRAIDSGERVANRQADSADKKTASDAQTAQQGQVLGFFGNLFGGIVKLFTGGVL